MKCVYFWNSIQKEIEDIINFNPFPVWFDHENKFISKMKKGVVLYTKINRNYQKGPFKIIEFYRKIASLRVLTHTVK